MRTILRSLACCLIVFETFAWAQDWTRDDFDLQTKGDAVNGVQLAFSIDREAWATPKIDGIFVDFTITNSTPYRRWFLYHSKYDGVSFLATGPDGKTYECLGLSRRGGLYNPIYIVGPDRITHHFVRLKKAELGTLIRAKAWASIKVFEQDKASGPSSSFSIQVPIEIK